MAYDPYRCLSDQELDAAIRRLVDALTSGASQISSPDAGSVGYTSVREGERILEKMERSRAARLGIPFDSGRRIRYTRVYITQDDVR